MGLKLVIWAFLWVRNFKADCFWVEKFWQDFVKVDKKHAHLRVLNLMSNNCISFIYKLNKGRWKNKQNQLVLHVGIECLSTPHGK